MSKANANGPFVPDQPPADKRGPRMQRFRSWLHTRIASDMMKQLPVLTHPGQWQLLPTVAFICVVSLLALAVSWHVWGWAGLASNGDRATASLAVVGGLGLIVSLVVAYRKQASTERTEVSREIKSAIQIMGESEGFSRSAGVADLFDIGDKHQEVRQQIIETVCRYLRTGREDDQVVESAIFQTLPRILNTTHPDRWQNIILDLHGATLNEPLQLSTCTLDKLNCDDAIFNGMVTLEKCDIAEQLSCEHTKFKNIFTLRHSCISEHATGDKYGERISFHDCEFTNNVSFTGTQFFEDVDFTEVLFSSSIIEKDRLSPESGISDFGFAQFHGEADFTGAQFFSNARFIGAAFHSLATFVDVLFLGSFKANKVTFPNPSETTASFLNCHFHGDASLRIIQFPAALWLASSCFCQYLNLTGSTVPSMFSTGSLKFRNPADIDFVQIDSFTIQDAQAKQDFNKQLKDNGYTIRVI